jgi:hypothetical protein
MSVIFVHLRLPHPSPSNPSEPPTAALRKPSAPWLKVMTEPSSRHDAPRWWWSCKRKRAWRCCTAYIDEFGGADCGGGAQASMRGEWKGLRGGCWCGVSVLGGEVGSRGVGLGVHRFEAMRKFGLSCSVDELGILVSLTGCPVEVQMSERVLLSFAVNPGDILSK